MMKKWLLQKQLLMKNDYGENIRSISFHFVPFSAQL